MESAGYRATSDADCFEVHVSIDEEHIALPKLYGGPAYARPPAIAVAARPFDPDDLPIEAFQSEEDREMASSLPARAWAPGGMMLTRQLSQARAGELSGGEALRPRPFNLRAIAGRLLGD